jgi:hypothetical protein
LIGFDQLEDMGVFDAVNSQSFLEDLASDSLGVNVSLKEAEEVSKRARNLQELFRDVDEVGDPRVEYWVARKEMEEYLTKLAPNSNLKVLTSTIRRSAMLFSVKSPTVNIVSNVANGIFTSLERRAGENNYAGLNSEYMLEYVAKVWDIYQKSGYDISRMKELYAGMKVLGEETTHSQGKGPIRAVGRLYEDVVFKQLMGAPDVLLSAAAFADSANLLSSATAKAEGFKGESAKERALELFKMATSVQATDKNAVRIREQAIAEAQLATWTNDGAFSGLAIGIRQLLNKSTGDLRFGDQVMPFVKTPANVVEYNLDVAGVSILKIGYRLPSVIRALKRGDASELRSLQRYAIRVGLGFTLTIMLASAIDPDDFAGEYEDLIGSGKNLVRAKNASYNAIRIGDKWISLDYFGPLAATFVGLMYAKKYGDTAPEKLLQYVRGVSSQALKVPGLRQVGDTVSAIADTVRRGDSADIMAGFASSTVDYFRTILLPSIVNDIAKGTDKYERKADTPLERIQSAIPKLREGLPAAVNQVTGEKVRTEGLVSALLFGSRVKTANNDPVVNEINRLYYQGSSPTISNIEYASKKMRELKEQISEDKFNEALSFYGEMYNKNVTRIIRRSRYKKSNAEDQKREIDSERREVLEKTLRKFKYRRPRVKSSGG